LTIITIIIYVAIFNIIILIELLMIMFIDV
jgi:hypothetical protein